MKKLLFIGVSFSFIFLFCCRSRVNAWDNFWDLVRCVSTAGCRADDSGAKCCGAGGCPELGADDPGPWSGYSWRVYKCTVPMDDCVQLTFKSSYQCYSGDICRSGYPTTDSYLEAGNCDVSGSTVNCYSSSSYKQCCQGSCPSGGYANGNPTSEVCTGVIPNRGGDRYGGCSVGSGSACTTCGNGGFIACTVGSYSPAFGTCKMGSVVPTTSPPPGVTATPTPRPPCNDCGSGTQDWCAPSAQACRDARGTVLDNPCPHCSNPSTVHCCTPVDSSCPAEMNIKGTSSTCDPRVEIEARHKPRRIGGAVDCGCAYGSLAVKIIGGPSGVPYGYHVCTITNSCDRWSSCFWDTTNMQAAPDSRANEMPVGPYPAGNYTLEIFYGGHTPNVEQGNSCSDPMCSTRDNTTLGYCPSPTIPPPCRTSTCPAGTVGREINLTSPTNFNPAFESYYYNWSGSTGTIGQGGDCCPWESQGCHGSCCPGGTSSGFCSTKWNDSNPLYNMNNTITGLKPNTNYLVQVSAWGARGSAGGSQVLQKPYLKMTSGTMSSAWYKITDNYRTSWGEAKPNGPWETSTCRWNTFGTSSIKVDLKGDGSPNHGHWGTPWGVSFDNLRLYECSQPKSCTINAAPIKNQGDPYTVTFSGTNLVAGEKVRLFIEKRDGTATTGLNSSDYLGRAGEAYYQIGECTGVNGSCTGQVNLSTRWPGADYYFHCDVPNVGSGGGCSGNPACSYEAGAGGFCSGCSPNSALCSSRLPCDGWTSCSSTDNRCFCINSPPVAPNPFNRFPSNGAPLSQDFVTLSWTGFNNTDWGKNCPTNNNHYAVYITEVELNQNCPTATTLFSAPNLKTAGRYGSGNCSNLTSASCNLSNLNWDKKYCWGIRASNGSGLNLDLGPYNFIVESADPWFQVFDGGIISGGAMVNEAPVTCVSPCKPVLSVGTISGDGFDSNGIVSAMSLSSTVGSTSYGTRNNFYHSGSNIVDGRYTHDWFRNEYIQRLKMEVTVLEGDKLMKDIGDSGLYIIDGNLTIDEDKTVSEGSYLFVVVRDNINLTNLSINKVDGIYVAEKIMVSGELASQVVFNGSLYARGGGISFTERSLNPKSMNNSHPSVVVNYRPDFLFNMPEELVKILTTYYDD